MLLCALERRGILRVTGPDAPGFLDNLLTRDLDDVTPDKAGYAALLTPQGKIIATMIVHRDADGFLLDVARRDSEALLKRLQIYRLRAKVEISEIIVQLAAEGTAILIVSSEMPEVIALSDRVIVMRSGHVAGELGREAITPEAVMNLATTG